MPKKMGRPTKRQHVHLYEGDWDVLCETFGESIGPSGAVRELVAKLVRNIRAKRADVSRDVEMEELDVDELITTDRG